MAAAGGVVAATAFPPFGLAPMIVVGLAPLLWMWRRASVGTAAFVGFAWGLGFFTVVMYWIVFFGPFALIPLMSALGATVALVGAGVALLARHGIRSAWVTASIWTLLEVVRGRFPLGGLPWADVGVAWAEVPAALDLARLGGATFVTFVVVLFTGLLVSGIDAIRRRDPRRQLARSLGGIGAVVAVVIVAALTASLGPATGELRFALLQGNDINRDLTEEERRMRYLPESHFELADSLEGTYDLIVFPESSMDRDPRVDPHLENELQRVAGEHESHVLTNAGVFEPDGSSFNMNLMYAPDGRLEGTYAKQNLVPFGEYVPFEGLVGWIPAVDQVPNRYSAGDETVVFDVGGTPIATIICFENAFADISRDAVRDGAEVIVVSTNNRSYRRSSNPAQHVNLSRMRAAETGRPVLHASISGITAVVDADGAVLETSELFVNGVTEGAVTARSGQTPYVRYGSWITVVSIASVAGAGLVAYARARRRSRPGPPVDSTTG